MLKSVSHAYQPEKPISARGPWPEGWYWSRVDIARDTDFTMYYTVYHIFQQRPTNFPKYCRKWSQLEKIFCEENSKWVGRWEEVGKKSNMKTKNKFTPQKSFFTEFYNLSRKFCIPLPQKNVLPPPRLATSPSLLYNISNAFCW